MSVDWKMELYWRLPVFLQEAGLSLYARHLDRLYHSGEYHFWFEEFKRYKDMSLPAIQKWQNDQLQAIVKLAATRVPYYRDTWRKLDWRSVRSSEDLHLLPLVEKQTVREHEKAFIVDGLPDESLWIEKTSGTTGTPLRVYWKRSTLPKWTALKDAMIRDSIGVSKSQSRAMMGTRPIVPGNTSKPPYWRYNRTWHQLYLSSYHISRDTAKSYADAIRHYGSEWMTGIGSAIAALAACSIASDIHTLPLKQVLVSGDTLLPSMRRSIETFFKCKCFDHYGQNEGVAMAMECSEGSMHVLPGIGIWEILRRDGSPCSPGEVGQIFGTTLVNDAMPLIRYSTGDYAAWAEDQTCRCRSRWPVITRLEGRLDDYLLTSDGRQIGRLSSAFTGEARIHSAQLVQDVPGHAFLLIHPTAGYSRADGIAIAERILKRVSNLRIELIEVSEIPKTLQGKTPLVIRLPERPNLQNGYRAILNPKQSTIAA